MLWGKCGPGGTGCEKPAGAPLRSQSPKAISSSSVALARAENTPAISELWGVHPVQEGVGVFSQQGGQRPSCGLELSWSWWRALGVGPKALGAMLECRGLCANAAE